MYDEGFSAVSCLFWLVEELVGPAVVVQSAGCVEEGKWTFWTKDAEYGGGSEECWWEI